jgi:phosphate transport system substrate-binding protein
MLITYRILFSMLFLWLFIGVQANAENPVVLGGSGADLETFRILTRAFKQHHPDGQFKILPSIGSSGAVRGVSTDRVDIGLMSRALKNKEKQYGLTVVHYADTGLIYIVAKESLLNNISTEKLLKIYSGEDAIQGFTPILRPQSDSDTLLLNEKFHAIKSALASAYKRKGVPVSMTDQSTIEMLIRAENSIATSTLSLIISEQRPVKILTLNNVVPSVENLSNNLYPLKKSLFIVHNGQLTGFKQKFIEFIFSKEGKAILSRTGHVPVGWKE